MIDKEIIINKQTRAIINGENGNLFKLGVDGENLQENLVFKFDDEFVNGTARVEMTMQEGTKSYVMTTKVNESYVLPIKSILTKKGLNKMQLVITQGTNDEEIPIFKSQMFDFFIAESVNADTEQPEGYPQWIERANTKLNEMDNFDIDAIKEENEATITVTDRYGISKSVQVIDGLNGKDAKINGINTLSLVAGENITIEQENDTLTINSQGGGSGGTSNYEELNNKPKINNIELTGNKSTSDLGIIIPTVPTNLSSFTDDLGTSPIHTHSQYLTQHQDISGKQDKIDNSHKLSADLVDDTETTNKFTNATEKATWNGKSDFSGSYNDLTNKPDLYVATQIETTPVFSTLKKGLYIDYKHETSMNYYINQNSTQKTLNFESGCEKIYYFLIEKTQDEVTEDDRNFGQIFYRKNNGKMRKAIISYDYSNNEINSIRLGGTSNYADVLVTSNQTISGVKTFGSLPKISSYTAPTTDTELVPKKYVDDTIGNINTILATLTTPSVNASE